MYIYILKKFKNIHNKNEIYEANNIYEVSDERYKEIIKNMKKQKQVLIRKATDEEIKKHLDELNKESEQLKEMVDNDSENLEGQDNND